MLFDNKSLIGLANIQLALSVAAISNILGVCASVGYLDRIGQSAVFCNRSVRRNIHSPVNIHAGIGHTGKGGILNGIAGSLERSGVDGKLCIELAGIKNIIRIQNIIRRITVTVILSQNVQRTDHADPRLRAGSLHCVQIEDITLGKVIIFHIMHGNGAFCLRLVRTLDHIVFAITVGVKDHAVAHIKHSMGRVTCALGDDITGTQGLFPVHQEILQIFVLIPVIKGHAIIIVIIAEVYAFSFVVPAQHHHIVRRFRAPPELAGMAVQPVAQNRIAQRLVINIPCVVAANRKQVGVRVCILQRGSSCSTPKTTGVLTQGLVGSIVSGIQVHGVILNLYALNKVVPCYLSQSRFRLAAGDNTIRNLRRGVGDKGSNRIDGCGHRGVVGIHKTFLSILPRLSEDQCQRAENGRNCNNCDDHQRSFG